MAVAVQKGKYLTFWCPACGYGHTVGVGDGLPPQMRWDWNGDIDKITLSPSVKLTCGRRTDPKYIPEPDDPPEVCHSFVRDGHIQYLSDCTHKYAGKTIPMEDFPDGYNT